MVLPPLDDRDRERERYAVYAVKPALTARIGRAPGPKKREMRELFSTPDAEGIGVGLVTLREESDITDDTRIGILDRVARKWVVNGWAKGTL